MVILDQPAMPMVKVGVKESMAALNTQHNKCQQNVPMLFAQWAIAEMFKALVEWLSKCQQLHSSHCSVAGC